MGSRGTGTSSNTRSKTTYKPIPNLATLNINDSIKDIPAHQMTYERDSIEINGEQFKPFLKTDKYKDGTDEIYETVYKSVNNFKDPRDDGERPATISITVRKHTTKSSKEKYSYVTKGLNKTRIW